MSKATDISYAMGTFSYLNWTHCTAGTPIFEKKLKFNFLNEINISYRVCIQIKNRGEIIMETFVSLFVIDLQKVCIEVNLYIHSDVNAKS